MVIRSRNSWKQNGGKHEDPDVSVLLLMPKSECVGRQTTVEEA